MRLLQRARSGGGGEAGAGSSGGSAPRPAIGPLLNRLVLKPPGWQLRDNAGRALVLPGGAPADAALPSARPAPAPTAGGLRGTARPRIRPRPQQPVRHGPEEPPGSGERPGLVPVPSSPTDRRRGAVRARPQGWAPLRMGLPRGAPSAEHCGWGGKAVKGVSITWLVPVLMGYVCFCLFVGFVFIFF